MIQPCDLMHNSLDIGDNVIFSYYEGSGMLYTGEIIDITERKVIVVPYSIYDGQKQFDLSRRFIDRELAHCYLLKIK